MQALYRFYPPLIRPREAAPHPAIDAGADRVSERNGPVEEGFFPDLADCEAQLNKTLVAPKSFKTSFQVLIANYGTIAALARTPLSKLKGLLKVKDKDRDVATLRGMLQKHTATQCGSPTGVAQLCSPRVVQVAPHAGPSPGANLSPRVSRARDSPPPPTERLPITSVSGQARTQLGHHRKRPRDEVVCSEVGSLLAKMAKIVGRDGAEPFASDPPPFEPPATLGEAIGLMELNMTLLGLLARKQLAFVGCTQPPVDAQQQ